MKILVCLDKSMSTEEVLTEARILVGFNKNILVKVLHIIDETIFGRLDDENNDIMKALKKRSHEIRVLAEKMLGNKLEYIERSGSPKEELSEALEEIPHDIVVVGSHGRTRLKNSLMGSFTEFVLKRSIKPVLVVPTYRIVGD